MSPISLNKIKFFKSEMPPPKKQQNNSTNNNGEKELSLWQKMVKNPFLFLVVFVAIIAYFISYIPSKSLDIPVEGEIATSDIIVPETLTIEDEQATEKMRQEAVDRIIPVYSLDPNIAFNTEEKIREFFNSGREMLSQPSTSQGLKDFIASTSEKYNLEISSNSLNVLIKVNFSADLEESLISLINNVSNRGVLLNKSLFRHDEQEKGLSLIRPEGERTINASDILDKVEATKALSEEIDKLELPQTEKSILNILGSLFISPNVTYNIMVTEARKVEARASVEPAYYNIKKGKVLARKGDEISSEVLEQIKDINSNLSAKPDWLTNFSGTFLLFALLFIPIWFYLESLLKLNEALRIFTMMGVTLILSLLSYKLSVFLSNTFSESSSFFLLKHLESYKFAFPLQFGTLVFAFLSTIPVALAYLVINSLLVGYLFQANFDLLVFCIIGGLAAIYGIKYHGKKNRIAIFKAAIFMVAPINILVIITFHLIAEKIGSADQFISELIMGLAGGLLSAALAFLLLPLFETLFSFVTASKLLEISSSDLPIFRQMALKAPGTYHHSVLVASMAENASEEIKLDPMLVKAGAQYHDIGKIKRPEYFIENRTRNLDMHKSLKPSMSTLVIINHVKEGVEKAKKLRLPKKIRDIIEQHHGNSLVKYFYEKAKEEYDPEMQKIGEESYRYPGPIPKTKEAALIMLADSVEAASRSLKSPTKTNLKRVISDIFNNCLHDGQLDDSKFSLKELKTVAASFLDTLYTVYHHRVEYPGFDFEMKTAKENQTTTKSNDRNSKPTT
jgi:putative nucleotidyltransferase with HDIG domain